MKEFRSISEYSLIINVDFNGKNFLESSGLYEKNYT